MNAPIFRMPSLTGLLQGSVLISEPLLATPNSTCAAMSTFTNETPSPSALGRLIDGKPTSDPSGPSKSPGPAKSHWKALFSRSFEERLYHRALISANTIKRLFEKRTDLKFVTPDFFVQAGTGLANLLSPKKGYEIKELCEIGFDELHYFPKLGAAGHQGKLVFAEISRASEPSDARIVVIAKGRKHLYEFNRSKPYGLVDVCLVSITMAMLNIDNYIMTNAVGSLYPRKSPVKSVVGINSQINLTGECVVKGPTKDLLFAFFTPVSGKLMTFSPDLLSLAKEIASGTGIPFREGVYSLITNSRIYEDPAQCDMARTIGADTVGESMTFETEALAAFRFRSGRNIRILGLSLISNESASREELTQLTPQHVEKIGDDPVCQHNMATLVLETILRNK